MKRTRAHIRRLRACDSMSTMTTTSSDSVSIARTREQIGTARRLMLCVQLCARARAQVVETGAGPRHPGIVVATSNLETVSRSARRVARQLVSRPSSRKAHTVGAVVAVIVTTVGYVLLPSAVRQWWPVGLAVALAVATVTALVVAGLDRWWRSVLTPIKNPPPEPTPDWQYPPATIGRVKEELALAIGWAMQAAGGLETLSTDELVDEDDQTCVYGASVLAAHAAGLLDDYVGQL